MAEFITVLENGALVQKEIPADVISDATTRTDVAEWVKGQGWTIPETQARIVIVERKEGNKIVQEKHTIPADVAALGEAKGVLPYLKKLGLRLTAIPVLPDPNESEDA